jgi:hypothetical protein
MLLRREAQAPAVVEPAQVRHPELAALTVPAPALESYDALLEAGR